VRENVGNVSRLFAARTEDLRQARSRPRPVVPYLLWRLELVEDLALCALWRLRPRGPSPQPKAAQKPLFSLFGVASVQVNAKASRLEHRSAKPPAVSARNPSETKSLLRMMHPRFSMLVRID